MRSTPLNLRTALCGLVALIAVGLVVTPAADARHQSRKKAIWGPWEVNGQSQFPIYRNLGVGIFQVGLDWSEVATRRPKSPRDPDDPAYAWPAYMDYVVAEARKHRIRVAVTLTRAPAWANGGRSSEWAPRKARDFGRFAEAASRRYPSVRLWMIWGEPSRAANFQPLPRFKPRGPRVYARILDSAYGHLKRASRRNLVIGGNTFTTGDVSPSDFLRFMRLRSGRRPRLDMWGHNPFSRRRPLLRSRPLGAGFVDFGTLDEFAKELDRYYPRKRGSRRRRSGRSGPVKLYLAEFTVPTGHENYAFNFWRSERTAASWLRGAMKTARRWNRIYTLGWYQLYDEPARPDGREALLGLLTTDGRKKPAYYTYRRG